jgi:hypothetical protein
LPLARWAKNNTDRNIYICTFFFFEWKQSCAGFLLFVYSCIFVENPIIKTDSWSTIPSISTNEQPPLILNNSTQKRPHDLKLEIQVLDWDRHKNVTGLNQLMGSQTQFW